MRTIGATRLVVHRTPRHIYAQIIGASGDRILASASTLDPDLRGWCYWPILKQQEKLAYLFPNGLRTVGIVKVAFDRSGFKYHGRVKALADAAREGGLEF